MTRGFLLNRGWGFWALATAAALTAACLLRPSIPMMRPVYRYLLVIDISQSMNAKDYHQTGLPADRLGYMKAAIRETLHVLPCGSEVGLGLFATQNTQILFDPLEVCEHFSVIDDVLDHIDWRMAWSGNSFVARGLYSALAQLAQRERNTRLAFFTDGEEVPIEPDPPTFNGKRGEISGLIVGVGGLMPVPIPRLDMENRMLGYWEQGDLNLNTGLAPAAPKGDHPLLLSKVDEAHLAALATLTGLRYQRLIDTGTLAAALTQPELGLTCEVDTDVRLPIALAAMLVWLSSLVVAAWQNRQRT